MNKEIDEIMMKYLGMDFEEASQTYGCFGLNANKRECKTQFVSPSLIAAMVKEIEVVERMNRGFDVMLVKDLECVVSDRLRYGVEGAFSVENDRYKINVTITDKRKGEEE